MHNKTTVIANIYICFLAYWESLITDPLAEPISLHHSLPLGSWQQVSSCSQSCQDWPFYTTPGLLPAGFFDHNQCAFLQEMLTERNCLRNMNSQSLTSVLVKVVWLHHQALPPACPQRHGWWVKLCLQHLTRHSLFFSSPFTESVVRVPVSWELLHRLCCPLSYVQTGCRSA